MQKQNKKSPEAYIINKGKLLPFYECLINADWNESGMATVVVTKKMPSGKLIVGLYLIDIYCLGLKDTTYKFALDNLEYADLLKEFNNQQLMVKCDLHFIHNLIYGSIDFAEEYGFSPNKYFKITEHLLDSSLIDDGIDKIEFGSKGKPLFIAGPHDDIRKIINTLEKNAGSGNYDYILPDE